MDEPSPIAHAEPAVPKKRRRPALSCVECRKRKVKCDRNQPCGPCKRMNVSTCTYVPNQKPARRAASPAIASAGRSSLTTASPCQTRPLSEFDSLLDRYLAPGLLNPQSEKDDDLETESRVRGNPQEPLSLIKALASRVRALEEKMEPESDRSDARLALPPRTVAVDPKNTVKSRFYGESHWMNSVEPVSSPHLDLTL